jgi:hypothetical protein
LLSRNFPAASALFLTSFLVSFASFHAVLVLKVGFQPDIVYSALSISLFWLFLGVKSIIWVSSCSWISMMVY